MRNAFTDYASRITPVADSPNVGFTNLQQPAIILFSKQSHGGQARADTDENENADFRRCFAEFH